MSKYFEIKSRIAELEAEAEQVRKEEIQDAIAQIAEIMKSYDLSIQEVTKLLGGSGKKSPPKYRDPASGKTWSGKGRQPQWFDQNREQDFLIA